MLFDIHDSKNAFNLMTYWLMTDGLRTDGLCLGLVVKFFYEAFESHFKTYNT
jgi:hypothetical protein